ncbi:MAG: hypothetical protein ACLSCV_05895 [Acutalibacteraceae bacterium]
MHKPCEEGEQPEILDEAIALIFRPASFTGEDVVELSCHGGLTIMKNVLRVVFEAGAVPAQPGEFTKRAFKWKTWLNRGGICDAINICTR